MCLSKQDPTTVDHSLKYFSRKPACGETYVLKEKVGMHGIFVYYRELFYFFIFLQIPYTEVLLNNTMTSLNKACTPFFNKENII